MENVHLVELEFYSRLHNPEYIDSIKLSGALFDAFAHIFPSSLKDIFTKVASGELRISSVFPKVITKKNEEIFLFPKPELPLDEKIYEEFVNEDFEEKEEFFMRVNFLKKLKKLKYVSENMLIKILNEGKYSYTLIENLFQNNEKYCKDFFYDVLFIEDMPRVTISRISQKSGIFYEPSSYPKVRLRPFLCEKEEAIEKINFFFFIKADEEEFERITSCLNFLEDRGLGSKYSLGYGKFRIIKTEKNSSLFKEILEKISKQHGLKYLLSKYIPNANDSISFKDSSYNLKWLRGVVHGYALPKLLCFTEGSCIKGNIAGILDSESFKDKYTLNGKPFYLDF